MYFVNVLPRIINIGYQGEGEVTSIQFDVSDWVAAYPSLPISISFTDPQDSTNASPFLASGVTLADGILTWLVGKDVTQHAGLGTIVVRCADGDVDKRSAMTQILIEQGHGATGDAPELMADWLGEAATLRQELADSVDAAGGSASAASGSAETATTKAGEAASSAQAASTSAGDANTAKQAAETARDTATTKAGEAAQSALAAAESAAVYDELAGTVAGHTSQLAEIASDVRRIDNALAPLSLNIDSWKSVQQAVKAGLAPKVFPIGTQLLVSHSVYGDRLYDVVAHDYLKSVHDQNAHTMTLLQHDLLSELQFDAPEAFYYAEVALPAGKYNFTIAKTYGSWLAGTYEFTLTQAVPAGGQLAISGYANAAMTTGKVYAFASRTTTTKTEECVITAGSGGTSLGTFGAELNHDHRVSYGSNNYKESAMRQFLNSSAAAGLVWTPQTKFDRPPSWLTTTAGFVAGLSQEFLAVVGDVVLPCSANYTYEAPDSTVVKSTKYTLNEKFYLPSQREVFGVNSDTVADDSVLLPFYDGATEADRIKYWDGVAVYWWLRTPGAWTASYVRRVNSVGALNHSYASFSHVLAPACTIV